MTTNMSKNESVLCFQLSSVQPDTDNAPEFVLELTDADLAQVQGGADLDNLLHVWGPHHHLHRHHIHHHHRG